MRIQGATIVECSAGAVAWQAGLYAPSNQEPCRTAGGALNDGDQEVAVMLQVTVRDEVSNIPVTMQLHGNRAALFVACDPCRRIDKIVDERQAVVMTYAIKGRMLDSFGAMME